MRWTDESIRNDKAFSDGLKTIMPYIQVSIYKANIKVNFN